MGSRLKILELTRNEILENPSFEVFKNILKASEKSILSMNNIFEQVRPGIEQVMNLQKSFNRDLTSSILSCYKTREPIYIAPSWQSLSPVKSPVLIRTRSSYELPNEAAWSKLVIKFFDGHTVKISYPGLPTKTFDYKDMGFVDRKTNNPDTKWNFLRTIAENNGSLTNAKYDRKFNRNIKYEANKILMEFFNMETPPIPNYTKKDGYRPLFAIYPRR